MRNINGFSSLVLLGIMGLLTAAMIVGIVVMSVKKSAPQAATTTSSQSTTDTQGKYVEQVLDLAPGIPASQKVTVVIQQADSSYEKVLLPAASVTSYISSLPKGAKVISQTPAGK